MKPDRKAIDLDLFRPSGALVPSPPADPDPDPAPGADGPRLPGAPSEAQLDHWTWSGHDLPRTHRYPTELLDALEDRTARLKLPVGLTVAAAIATLLDLDDDDLEVAVRRAHSARPPKFGRR